MLFAFHNNKVRWGIVCFVTINVVYNFIRAQATPEHFFSDHPMFMPSEILLVRFPARRFQKLVTLQTIVKGLTAGFIHRVFGDVVLGKPSAVPFAEMGDAAEIVRVDFYLLLLEYAAAPIAHSVNLHSRLPPSCHTRTAPAQC